MGFFRKCSMFRWIIPLNVTYSESIGEGVWHLFLFVTYIFTSYSQNNHEKNKLTHKIPRVKNLAREEILDP